MALFKATGKAAMIVLHEAIRGGIRRPMKAGETRDLDGNHKSVRALVDKGFLVEVGAPAAPASAQGYGGAGPVQPAAPPAAPKVFEKVTLPAIPPVVIPPAPAPAAPSAFDALSMPLEEVMARPEAPVIVSLEAPPVVLPPPPSPPRSAMAERGLDEAKPEVPKTAPKKAKHRRKTGGRG